MRQDENLLTPAQIDTYVIHNTLRYIVNLKIDENRYKQKISTDPYSRCYSYAVFSTKF